MSAQPGVKELSLRVSPAHPQSKRICRLGSPAALFADRITSESSGLLVLRDSHHPLLS